VADIERVMVDEGVVAVIVEGELDLADEARADLAIDFVVGLEIPGVLIDLTECDFIDAAGLRMLLRGSQRVLRSGARLAIAPPGPQVRRLLEITGIADELSIYESRDEAFRSLRGVPT
jgi:anti-sigma B factor antagonist